MDYVSVYDDYYEAYQKEFKEQAEAAEAEKVKVDSQGVGCSIVSVILVITIIAAFFS